MAQNAKDIQLRDLKDLTNELRETNRLLKKMLEESQKREEELKQERDNLKGQIDYLTKKLFGSSSEKGIGQIPGQMDLFNEVEASADPSLEEEDAKDATEENQEEVSKKGPRKKRSTDKERYKGVPVEKRYLEPSEGTPVCEECGSLMEKIGEEFVRRELRITPARAKVIEYYSVNYACKQCMDDAVSPTIVKGKDGKAHMMYGMASASTVAWIIYQKYCNGMPLYRIEQDLGNLGVKIGRATLSNWVIKNGTAFFTPMYEFFHRRLLERGFAMADETPVQILHEPGRRAQTQSYMWLFRSGEDGEYPIILYKYSETRAGDTAVDFLDGFHGYLMCDGYSGYNKVKTAKRLACWAHVRRYLIDAIPKGKQLDYSQPSVQGVMYINQLFDKEDKIRKKYKTFDAIKEARDSQERPIIEGFLSWLDKQEPVRNSRLDKAVTYVRNRREHLATYLEDGRCSFSNNLSENSIRPFVVGRKGWLFCNTPAGAETSAMAYTMVEMAKANGVNPYHYLTFLFEKQPNENMSDDELEQLAPWNDEVKSEIQKRIEEQNRQ
nr:IS66 family transposase [uncultured Blautia sp.]